MNVSNDIIIVENKSWDWECDDNKTGHVDFLPKAHLFKMEKVIVVMLIMCTRMSSKNKNLLTPLTHDSSSRLALDYHDHSRETRKTRLIIKLYNDTEETVLEESFFNRNWGTIKLQGSGEG